MNQKMEYQEVNQTPFIHRAIYLSVALLISTASIVAMQANANTLQPTPDNCLEETCTPEK